MNQFPRLAFLTLVTNTIYLVWLFFVMPNPLFFILETMVISLTLLFIFNNRRRTYVLNGGEYSLRPIVDIFLTTKNEKEHIVEKTVSSAVHILYPNKRIYILDDGGRAEIKKLAAKYGCTYLSRYNSDILPYKAANLNYGLRNSFGSFILTLDADMQANPNILDELMGFFKDEKVGFVSTRQGFNTNPQDFNNEHLFYEYMQVGKNTNGVGISCGSGVIYRRSALEAIGGFQEWNLVEDLYTSYVLNSSGYKSVYVPQAFTQGDAPVEMHAIYKQRGVWAQDTLRLLIYKNPFFQTGLSLAQKLQYLEIGYSYIVSGLVFPLIYLMNMYSLVANDPIIVLQKEWYVILRAPSFIVSLLMFATFSKGTQSMRMWAGLFPIYFLSLLKAIGYKKAKYQVTPKGVRAHVSPILVIPQATFVLAGVGAVLYHVVVFGFTWVLAINTFWVCVMIYFMTPVLKRALVKNKLW